MKIRIRALPLECFRAQGTRKKARRPRSLGGRKHVDCFQLGEKLERAKDRLFSTLRYLTRKNEHEAALSAGRAVNALRTLREMAPDYVGKEVMQAEKRISKWVEGKRPFPKYAEFSSELDKALSLLGKAREKALKRCKAEK